MRTLVGWLQWALLSESLSLPTTMSPTSSVIHRQLLICRCEFLIAAWLDMVLAVELPTWYMKLYVYRMCLVSTVN